MRLLKWLYQHKGFILMVLINGLLFYGFYLASGNYKNFPNLLQIQTHHLRLASSMMAIITALIFLATGWWILKKNPHPQSHGFFKFAWICSIPAFVLSVSSISVSPEVPEEAFTSMRQAIEYFEVHPPKSVAENDSQVLLSKKEYDLLVNGYQKLKQGLVEAHRGQVEYYLMRLHHRGFTFSWR